MKNRSIVRSFPYFWAVPVLLALLEGLTHFAIWHGDSSNYVSIMKIFRDSASAEDATALHWHGILRPVALTLALPLSYVMNYKDALAVINLGFLLLGTFFTYLFAKRLFDDRAGFIAGMCFASAAPNLAFGVAVLTDGPAYAMEIITIYYLLFVFEENRNFKTALSAGLLMAAAILAKETNIVILLFLGMRLILHRDRNRITHSSIVGIVGITLPLIWSTLVNYSYLNFYGAGLEYHSPGYKGALLHPTLFLISILYAFFLCIPFAFTGFLIAEDSRFKITSEIILSVGVLLLLWPTFPESRFTFWTFPAVLPLAALGIIETAKTLSRRPWLRFLNLQIWLTLIIIAIVAYTNVVSFKLYFRLPWYT